MSRGGGNPNWEYQLIDPSGHTKDTGLRQRGLVAGTYSNRMGKQRKPRAKKAVFAAPKLDTLEALKELFK